MSMILAASVGLWVGVALLDRRFSPLSGWDCVFGNWWFFGRVVDLQSGSFVYIALGVASFLSIFYVGSILTEFYCRRSVVKAIGQAMSGHAIDDLDFRRHIVEEGNNRILGDHLAAWFWKQIDPILGNILPNIYGHRVGLREMTIVFRSLMWAYLIIATEGVIRANNFAEENQVTYGQAYPLVLLVVPIGVAGNIIYRMSATLREWCGDLKFQTFLAFSAALFIFNALVIAVITMLRPLSEVGMYRWISGGIIAGVSAGAFAIRWFWARQFRILAGTQERGAVNLRDIWTVQIQL